MVVGHLAEATEALSFTLLIQYSVHWAAPAAQIELVLADQELATTVRHWESGVDITGMRGEIRIDGRNFVEQTR